MERQSPLSSGTTTLVTWQAFRHQRPVRFINYRRLTGVDAQDEDAPRMRPRGTDPPRLGDVELPWYHASSGSSPSPTSCILSAKL